MTSPPNTGAVRGIAFLVAAMSLFAMVDGFSKMLVAHQSFGQIMLARYILTLPAMLLMFGPARWPEMFRTAHPALQFWRGFSPVMVGGSMVLALTYLPLAEATVILFAGPFLVVALSGPLLGERVRLTSWIAVALGFVAVLLVSRPGLGMRWRPTTSRPAC